MVVACDLLEERRGKLFQDDRLARDQMTCSASRTLVDETRREVPPPPACAGPLALANMNIFGRMGRHPGQEGDGHRQI
jgi:hypothetical protein